MHSTKRLACSIFLVFAVSGVARAQGDIQPARHSAPDDGWGTAGSTCCDVATDGGKEKHKCWKRLCCIGRGVCSDFKLIFGSSCCFYRCKLKCEDGAEIMIEETGRQPLEHDEYVLPPRPDFDRSLPQGSGEAELPMPRKVDEFRGPANLPGGVTRFPPLREWNR